MGGRLRWGDADDDDDVLPVSTSTGPNEKGVITKVDYVRNPKGDAVKRTTKIQIVKTETRVYDVRSPATTVSPLTTLPARMPCARTAPCPAASTTPCIPCHINEVGSAAGGKQAGL